MHLKNLCYARVMAIFAMAVIMGFSFPVVAADEYSSFITRTDIVVYVAEDIYVAGEDTWPWEVVFTERYLNGVLFDRSVTVSRVEGFGGAELLGFFAGVNQKPEMDTISFENVIVRYLSGKGCVKVFDETTNFSEEDLTILSVCTPEELKGAEEFLLSVAQKCTEGIRAVRAEEKSEQ